MNINILINYKSFFETKHNSVPYESGMDKKLIKDTFEESGYKVNFIEFSQLDLSQNYNNQYFLYTSSEDIDSYYKDYIEDIILHLSLNGAIMIPDFKFLRAHNNKVFMEFLGKSHNDSTLDSFSFGTFEDLEEFVELNPIKFPLVIKSAKGAVSSGVALTFNKEDLFKKAKNISRSKNFMNEFRDYLRSIRHKGYIRESKYRKKFIIQEFIPDLENDWKIYFFGEKLYVWFRYVRDNDFRASGSGLFEFNENVPIPNGLFDFAYGIYKKYDVPFISLDVAFDGKSFHLIEKQFLFFGKNGHHYSDYYYMIEENKWIKKDNIDTIEKVYVDSIIKYIDDK